MSRMRFCVVAVLTACLGLAQTSEDRLYFDFR